MRLYVGENEIRGVGFLLENPDIEDATASVDQVLEGEVFYNNDGKSTGTMVNQGAVSEEIAAGASYTVPQGYHNGSGTITAKTLAEQTRGTAAASDILTNKTAYVNGVQVTGSMVNQGAVSQSLNAGASYTIPAGYHNGSGKITANSLASQTDGDATAADILSGKTAYVDGAKVTGAMVDNGAVSQTVNPGSSYTVPVGYHNGSGKVSGPALSALGDATAADVASGKTFTSAAGLNVVGTSTAVTFPITLLQTTNTTINNGITLLENTKIFSVWRGTNQVIFMSDAEGNIIDESASYMFAYLDSITDRVVKLKTGALGNIDIIIKEFG